MTHPASSGPQVNRRTLVASVGGVATLAALGTTAGSRMRAGATSGPAAGVSRAASVTAIDPLELLKKMISFDTQNFGEGGNTRPHSEWLKSVWDDAGVPAEIIDTPQPNNVHLIARIPGKAGSTQKPLLLLGHSDVVPVEKENWSVDPFGGTVTDGEIYGRGALDMKGANAASIAALLRHLSEGAQFDRDIIVLTDCDEEAGSYGSGWLAKQHWDKLDCGMVLTEGAGSSPSPTERHRCSSRSRGRTRSTSTSTCGRGARRRTRASRCPTRRSSHCRGRCPSSATSRHPSP
jgi:hypothetical protein